MPLKTRRFKELSSYKKDRSWKTFDPNCSTQGQETSQTLGLHLSLHAFRKCGNAEMRFFLNQMQFPPALRDGLRSLSGQVWGRVPQFPLLRREPATKWALLTKGNPMVTASFLAGAGILLLKGPILFQRPRMSLQCPSRHCQQRGDDSVGFE